MRRITKVAVLVLLALLMATAADAQQRRKREREREAAPAQAAPPDRRDRLVAAPGTPFNGRPYWQVLAQCGGIYFKLNNLYALSAIQAKVVKPDPAANARFGKMSDGARRNATAFFEAAERFLVADRSMPREDAVLMYDNRANDEGERHKTADVAEKAAQPCPALYQICRDLFAKICSESELAASIAPPPESASPPTACRQGRCDQEEIVETAHDASRVSDRLDRRRRLRLERRARARLLARRPQGRPGGAHAGQARRHRGGNRRQDVSL